MTEEMDAKPSLEETNPPAASEQAGAGDYVDSRFGVSSDPHVYNMNHKTRGMFIIINNKNFLPKTGMGTRSGTDRDATQLYQRFKELSFDVVIYNDQMCVEMLKILAEAAKSDHSNADCFGCAILSHGDDGVVYGTDNMIEINRLVAPFKGNAASTLLGKPKIFIVQACRGDKLDHGVTYQADASKDEQDKVYRIPTEADFLYAYSTVPGYYSWRNSTRGSWFIQALCQVLKDYGRSRDIMWVLTRVSYEVAYSFESNASKESMNRKKQIPSIVSMLTKELVFNKK